MNPLDLQKNEFKLNINQHLPLTMLTKFSRDQLIGKSFEFKNMKILMNDFVLSENKSRLVAKIHTSGSLDGIIMFDCLPHFNYKAQRFDLHDPQISIQTGNLLQKGAIWMFKSRIEEMIREKIEALQSIKLNELLEELRLKYGKINLNEDLQLDLKLEQFEIQEGGFKAGQIALQIALKGVLEINDA